MESTNGVAEVTAVKVRDPETLAWRLTEFLLDNKFDQVVSIFNGE
jgi:hypothetical protein